MINNGVWLSKLNQVGTFQHINDRMSHQNNLVSIYSADHSVRPSSTNPRRPHYGQLVAESIGESINTHSYFADVNPQQVYLRSGGHIERLRSAKYGRQLVTKYEKFKQEKAKAENDQLFDRMCSILVRKNRHQHHNDSQEYRLALINPAPRKVTESKRLFSENMRLLSTIHKARSSCRVVRPVKLFRRPLASEHNTQTVERYLMKKAKTYQGTVSAYCMDDVFVQKPKTVSETLSPFETSEFARRQQKLRINSLTTKTGSSGTPSLNILQSPRQVRYVIQVARSS